MPIETVLEEKLVEYLALKRAMKDFEAREKELKTELRSMATNHGAVNDKGSQILDLGPYRISNERRVTRKLKSDAYQILKDMGLEDDDLSTLFGPPLLDSALVEQAYYQGRLGDEHIQAIIDAKESFALMVEETDEEGQTKRDRRAT